MLGGIGDGEQVMAVLVVVDGGGQQVTRVRADGECPRGGVGGIPDAAGPAAGLHPVVANGRCAVPLAQADGQRAAVRGGHLRRRHGQGGRGEPERAAIVLVAGQGVGVVLGQSAPPDAEVAPLFHSPDGLIRTVPAEVPLVVAMSLWVVQGPRLCRDCPGRL